MAEGDVRQYWVRNDRGTLWGPLTLPTIELLIDSGSIKGKLQVSEDGINFAFPWRFPEARDTFPRELWGDGAPDVPRGAGSAPAIGQSQWTGADGGAPVAGPGANPGGMPTAGPGANPGGAPMAGPGAVARPGPGAAPMAGPGTRPGDPRVPGNPMAAQQGARPGVPGAVPGAPNVAARPAPGVATAPGVASAPGRPATAPGAGVAPQAGAAARPAGAPQAPGGVAPQAGAPAAVARPAGAPQAPGGVAPPAGATNVGAPPARAPGSPQSGSHAAVVTEASGYAVPARGQLEQTSPLNLYGRMASAELTGLLTLTLSDRVTLIHFRKGNPEYVDSTHAEDALGTSLMGAKLLNPEQLQQAESAKERFGGDLLAALFGLGLLQPASAFAILAQRASSILFKGLRAEAGTFTFEVRELAGNKSMPLGNRWAVLSDTVRRMPSTDIKRRLMPVLQLPIMKAGGMVAASDLRLTPHEVRALTVIDGVRSVNQLLTDFPQDADHLLRIAFLLRELDAVSFAAVSPTSAGPRPAAPTPGAAAASPQPAPGAAAQAPRPGNPPGVGTAPAGAARPATGAAPGNPPGVATAAGAARPGNPPGAATAAPGAARPGNPPGAAAAPGAARPGNPPGAAPRPAGPPTVGPATGGAPPTVTANAPGSDEIPSLRQLVMALKQQNHFQRLGLAEQADSSAVKVAYFRLAKLYHPDTLPQGAPPELEKLKAEVFAYIGDAYRTLSDDKSRASYLEELKSGGGGAEVDINAILQAEELFQKACILVKARKFPEAVKMLNEAIQLNAEEAEFYAWRGYARFFTATDKKAAQPEASREIQNAIKRNERCAPAHYFLGVIAKLSGDAPGSLKHFKRTVELQPDHIDAQREIRMAAQKK
ncbi:DnaJ domain-containing protein [Myxococcus sp. AM011]|uniref:DnaJ domain-containing protein n=2 Tax=Myxococcus TaxID=32 RepID=UPI00159561B3|nr:DnaJ domain-containing protein [Myxococcus sp. AM011]NVJ23302.1 DnaJ domain-containing protein [Myxococcus sp. AM011]